MLVKFDVVLSKLEKLEWGLSISGISGIILLNTINLFLRWFVGFSLPWILEVSLLLFIWSTLLCVPALYKNKELIQMQFLEEILDKSKRRYVNFILEIIILAFLIYLLFYSLKFSVGQVYFFSRGLGIPRIYVTISLPVATFLTILVSINNIIHQVKDILQKR